MTGLAHCPGASRPTRASSARFTFAFPERSAALKLAGRSGSFSGIPHRGVDAVANPDERAGAPLQNAFESEALLGRLDLLRVTAADRRHDLREVDAGLEEADVVPELEAFPGEHVPRQVEGGQHFPAEDALIRQVVDREDGAGPRERGMPAEPLFQVRGHQARLPVVRVDDGRAHPRAGGALEGRPREQGKPQVVVGVIPVRARVELLPIVVSRAIHEPEPDAIVVDALEDAEVGRAKPRAAPEGGDGLPFLYAAVARRHHRYVVPEVRKRRRERAAHVAEASGLRVRDRLGHDHEDVVGFHGYSV